MKTQILNAAHRLAYESYMSDFGGCNRADRLFMYAEMGVTAEKAKMDVLYYTRCECHIFKTLDEMALYFADPIYRWANEIEAEPERLKAWLKWLNENDADAQHKRQSLKVVYAFGRNFGLSPLEVRRLFDTLDNLTN